MILGRAFCSTKGARAWLRLTALLLFLSGFASEAHAERSRIALVQPVQESPVAREARVRLMGELHALGFEVVLMPAKSNSAARETVEDASGGAFAAMSIINTPRGPAVDLWVADHLTKKTTVQRVEVGPDEVGSAMVVAVRAVELLHASLLGGDARAYPDDVARFVSNSPTPAQPPLPSTGSLRQASAPSAPAPPPALYQVPQMNKGTKIAPEGETAQPLGPEAQSESRSSISLGVGLLSHLDGEAPNIGPLLQVSYRLTDTIALESTLSALGWGFTRSRPGGTLRLTEAWATVGGSWEWAQYKLLHVRASAGLGVHRGWVVGVAEAPHHSHSRQTAGFAGSFANALDVDITEAVALTGEIRMVIVAPRFDLRVLEDNAGSIGPVNIGASLGIRYRH